MGTTVSLPAYDARQWYPIQHMPATVLEILRENGLFPNLYSGMNLVAEVPQDLYKQDWWYRVAFKVPQKGETFWLDFPGINYRAEIWLNGRLVADSRQIVGMYVGHTLNVTPYIRRGAINVLAVKVTPEQKIRNLDGVELADSWVNWINWKYIGYKGPLGPHYLDASAFKALYVRPGHSEFDNNVTSNVEITAASTAGVTLTGTVKADGAPVSEGSVVFTFRGEKIGSSSVASSGVGSLTINTPVTHLFNRVAGISFVADRNAGIWKPVSFHISGPVTLSNAFVATELPLPKTSPASLTVYVDIENTSSAAAAGSVEGELFRQGKLTVHFSQKVALEAGERREIEFSAKLFPQLNIQHPDLWWPYTLGKPALYQCRLSFITGGQISDTQSLQFGIRTVIQKRDQDEQIPKVGKGGDFYLQINGKNFLIRGGAYTPDLLYRDDPQREQVAIRYAKDLGLNMLRWESKISSTHIIDLADKAGVPVMLGWMCCDQWEHWSQWDEEDQRVARESLRSQILMLRAHPSVFIWANGSDGRPPDPVRQGYHTILSELHWQNAVVDTASSFTKDANGNALWDGIHMEGPYTWRPPSYWFSGRYAPTRGSCAEQGDTELIPPYESLRKFIPGDKLWPINDYWFFHAGASEGVNEIRSKQVTLERRYGPSHNAEEFAAKAQMAAYENTRAQFEDFGANDWDNHKMTIYWMFNTPWPTFYSGLYDYYQKPGGAYYGAKKGLRPLSVVFDSYATGDHTKANIHVVNQTTVNQSGLRVRIRVYDLLGQVQYDRAVSDINVDAHNSVFAMAMPAIANISGTYFVRCQLFTSNGHELMNNVYWQSSTMDNLGDPKNDQSHGLNQETWADLTALKVMPKVRLDVTGSLRSYQRECSVRVGLHNPTNNVAFFERVEVTKTKGGEEMLPIIYDDNYVTVFPGETLYVNGTFMRASEDEKCHVWVSVTGYNTSKESFDSKP